MLHLMCVGGLRGAGDRLVGSTVCWNEICVDFSPGGCRRTCWRWVGGGHVMWLTSCREHGEVDNARTRSINGRVSEWVNEQERHVGLHMASNHVITAAEKRHSDGKARRFLSDFVFKKRARFVFLSHQNFVLRHEHLKQLFFSELLSFQSQPFYENVFL